MNFRVSVKERDHVTYTRDFGNVRFALNHSMELYDSREFFQGSLIEVTASQGNNKIVIETLTIKGE